MVGNSDFNFFFKMVLSELSRSLTCLTIRFLGRAHFDPHFKICTGNPHDSHRIYLLNSFLINCTN